MNYEQDDYYEDVEDAHAKARDKKLNRRNIDKMMRGNRSVFTMKDAQRKRDDNTLSKHRRGLPRSDD